MGEPVGDAELVARCLEGSERAFETLVERYQGPVFRLIARMVRNRAVAEELAQEVFFKAYRALDSFEPSRKFSSWLFKIAHNATIDHLRSRQPVTVPLEAGSEETPDLLARLPLATAEDPEAAAARGDLAAALEAAIATLRPAYREVVLLRYREELAYEEIAEVMDLPLGTVKTHLHRGRRELAQRLREMGWSPGAGGETREPRPS